MVKNIKELEETTEETITIKKSELDEIMKRLARVEYASDNARTAKFDEKTKSKQGSIVSLRTIDDRIITKWKLIEDVVKKDTNGEWVEKQTVELTFTDGKTKSYPYSLFSSNYQKLPCDVVSKKQLFDETEIKENGNNIFILKTPELETIEVGELYVN
jgi:hypothetical protein